jgi:hypothetical protein
MILHILYVWLLFNLLFGISMMPAIYEQPSAPPPTTEPIPVV